MGGGGNGRRWRLLAKKSVPVVEQRRRCRRSRPKARWWCRTPERPASGRGLVLDELERAFRETETEVVAHLRAGICRGIRFAAALRRRAAMKLQQASLQREEAAAGDESQ